MVREGQEALMPTLQHADVLMHLDAVLELAEQHPEIPKLPEWAATYLIRRGPEKLHLVVYPTTSPLRAANVLGVAWLEAVRQAVVGESASDVLALVRQVVSATEVEVYGVEVSRALDAHPLG